jgi:hypothetical protein
MSIEVIDDDFMVCTDCLVIIANDDSSGLDYSMGDDEAANVNGPNWLVW